MKTIVLPLLRTENSIGAIGPIEILTKTCGLWRQLNEGKSRSPLFGILVVSDNRKPVTFANGIPLPPTATLDGQKAALIVVQSIHEELDPPFARNEPYEKLVTECF